MLTTKMRLTQSRTSAFFVAIFLFWLAGGLIMAIIRTSATSAEIIGFNAEYGDIYGISYQYILFIFAFYLFSIIIKEKKLTQDASTTNIEISLLLAGMAAFIKITSYGAVLFSGDYYSRFNANANLLVNICPTVLCIVAIDFMHSHKKGGSHINKWHIYLILGVALLTVLSGSRSTAFYAAIAALAYSFIPQDKNLQIKISTKNLILLLIIIYLAGQASNILRWFSTEITLQNSLIAILGDSFPEYRSHALGADRIQASQTERYSIFLWLENLSAYILPGFVFEAFGQSRTQTFNQIWKDFFEPIFWQGGESLFGIRTGLIGEISLALGAHYVLIFALVFATITNRSNSKVIPATCLAGTIPYGATSLFMLFYCLLFRFIIKKISKAIPRKST